MNTVFEHFKYMLSSIFYWVGSKFDTEEYYEETEEVVDEDSDDQKMLSLEQRLAGDRNYRPWTRISNFNPDVFEQPDIGFIYEKQARQLMFHVYLWLNQNGAQQNSFAFKLDQMVDAQTWTPTICGFFFGANTALNEFKVWRAAYLKQFPTDGKNLLPLLPDSCRFTGTAIRHNGVHYNETYNDIELSPPDLEIWSWIIANCKGRVWVTNNSFIFEDDGDAVLYKLSPISEK
jgi:hypothetical protein